MDWKSHAVIGAVASLAAAWLLGVHDTFGLAFFFVFGGLSALVPDLDHDASKGRQILDMVAIGFAATTAYMSGCGDKLCIPAIQKIGGMVVALLAMVGVYFLFFKFFKPRHRGITHTLVACFVFGVLLSFLTGLTLAIVGSVGYLSHLVADWHIKVI
ncbi:metal-dependent hydrolase [Candidatus Micrarchaeota archaeon]|nr:metal-dependent hydrolase [Candidatus Micrarchaeota archaeon]